MQIIKEAYMSVRNRLARMLAVGETLRSLVQAYLLTSSPPNYDWGLGSHRQHPPTILSALKVYPQN